MTETRVYIHPSPHRLTLIESEVEPGEERCASGPIVKQDTHPDLKRGVVVIVGSEVPLDIENGTVVYYTHGMKVNDIIVVPWDHIYAWEVDQ